LIAGRQGDMPSDTLERLIGQPEGQTLEYKTVVPPPSLIARVVASFANSDGGYLICGVRDDLAIQGIADEVPAPSIVDSALARLRPRPTVNHYFVEIEGKRLYILEVAKSLQSVTTEQGVIYSRVGDHTITSRLATEGERGKSSQHKSVDELLIKLEGFKVKGSESKQRLIEQYINLTQLIERSTPSLCPEKTSVVTNIAEGKVLARLLLSSFADTFETYLADLLFEIYLAKPETLRSSSSVTVQEVLDCLDREAFIRFVATRKISGLKKGNVKGLIEENKQIQGLGVFSDSIITEIDELFQIRHLYVHSNGRVDSKFANSVSGRFQVGDEHQMTVDEICKAANLLSTTVDQLDKAAIAKYALSISEP
jgi:hypothetical protein